MSGQLPTFQDAWSWAFAEWDRRGSLPGHPIGAERPEESLLVLVCDLARRVEELEARVAGILDGEL